VGKLARSPQRVSPADRLFKSAASRARGPAREAAELLFDLLMAQKKVSQAIAKDFGLTLQQAAALRRVAPGEGVPMSVLADALSCDAANITAVVDKLEARDLVKRAASADRRVRLIETTDRGRAMREEMLARLREPTPWITVLSREDQAALRDLLRKGLAGIPSELDDRR
jgi:MarR family transcriptional regulator, organic hydroperoxide resistance regulator